MPSSNVQRTRAVLSDDIATCLPLMRARYALAVRANQRRHKPQYGAGEDAAKTISWQDAFTVTPLHLVVLS